MKRVVVRIVRSLLDFIGDIYAIGNIRGHFEVQRSGHGLNNLFLKEFSDL